MLSSQVLSNKEECRNKYVSYDQGQDGDGNGKRNELLSSQLQKKGQFSLPSLSSVSNTPVMLWWEDMIQDVHLTAKKLSGNGVDWNDEDVNANTGNGVCTTGIAATMRRFTLRKEDDKLSSSKSYSPIPERSMISEQVQIPIFQRIAKGIYEECAPWILAIITPIIVSLIFQNSFPLYIATSMELIFLIVILMKLSITFDPPIAPQPLLENREWKDVVDNVWKSHKTVEEKRRFIMGWFFGADFELLRREDALKYLAWMVSKITSYMRGLIATSKVVNSKSLIIFLCSTIIAIW